MKEDVCFAVTPTPGRAGTELKLFLGISKNRKCNKNLKKMKLEFNSYNGTVFEIRDIILMFSEIKEFLKVSSATEAESRTANIAKSSRTHFALSYGQNNKKSTPRGREPDVSKLWERNKERVFTSLFTYGGILAGLISSSILSSIQPLFLVISVYFTNPIDKYLFGLAIASNEIGFCVSVLICHKRYNCLWPDEEHRLMLIHLGLYLNILSITGYILTLYITEMYNGSAALYLIIISRFFCGLISHGQLESFSIVSEHFILHVNIRPETPLEKKDEEQHRRKLVTRHDFTFLESRVWWGPLFGLLLFFLLPYVRYPLSRSRKELLILNFYTANSWLFLILCILAVFIFRRQHPNRSSKKTHINGSEESKSEYRANSNKVGSNFRQRIEVDTDGSESDSIYDGGYSSSLSRPDASKGYDCSTDSIYYDGKESSDSDSTSDRVYYSTYSNPASRKCYNDVDDGVYHSSVSSTSSSKDFFNAYKENNTKNPILSSKLLKDQFDTSTDNSSSNKSTTATTIATEQGLILIFMIIDIIAKFCVWGLYFVLFSIALQFNVLKTQRDLWKIYLPMAIGGSVAGLIIDFRKIKGFLLRYRSDCLKQHALISITLGLLSLFLSFLLLLGIDSFMDRENAEWCLFISIVFLGTGIAWFFKPCQGIMLELISKLHDQQYPQRWLRYTYFHIMGSSLARLLGTLIAGTLLVYQPKFTNDQNLESLSSLQCGITTQSYVIGVYMLSGNQSTKRNDISCSLTYYKGWLIFNIILICSAIILLLITIVKSLVEYVTVSDFLSSSIVDISNKTTKKSKVKFSTDGGTAALNPEHESDAIRYLYDPREDISDLQYDVRD